uniref:4-(cytidine 5'-diphospho)-2-C-methyl-D-erythritol kinase n=1 Tax=Candidatus Cryptobacteroides bacterium TaxID=3085639 RepID=UPI00402880ED
MITNPPVKINLGLNVLRKRPDGFHDLETLFYPCLQIHDTLEIIQGDDYSRTSARLCALYGDRSMISDMSCRASDSIDEESDEIPTLSQGISSDGKLMITVARKEGVDWPVLKDLCAKAYQMLDADFGLPPVKIYLEKTSPVGAGLGGGSADAAYTLKMLAEMFGLDVDEQKLRDYAARLGSDCAFFVSDSPMIGEGRGEILTPYDLNINIVEDESSARPGDYLLKIIVPEEIHVSTAEAYKGIVPSVPEHSLKDVLAKPVEAWKDLLINDFERTVFVAHPEIEAIKRSLYDSGAEYASMSGSGSALFALYKV